MLHLRYKNVVDIGPLGVPETPSRMWYRQDTPKGECPWDVLGTPGGTVGQVGHWDNSQGMESLGCRRNSQWDSGTDRTLGQRQRCGSPWDVPATLLPFSGTWDSSIGNGNAVGVSGHECSHCLCVGIYKSSTIMIVDNNDS